MKPTLMGLVAVLMIVAITGSGTTAVAQGTATSPAKSTVRLASQEKKMMEPSIDGTYKLVSRKLPDGKTLMPPDIEGLQTFTRGYRNFNIGWHNPDGKRFSYSVISQYRLNDKEYSETLLYSVMNDEIGIVPGMKPGAGPQYSASSETKTSPVTMTGGRYKFRLPFDPPEIEIGGGKFIATMPDGSVDSWEKVQ